ncbi:development-specific protein LVN1.2-like [Patiria miniata]|uniref:Uncharacterized protein n=1 Tax=Patiria miniata TaxID=46514 RepID=A0A914A515_PATMI|nr:development-specific protein LVN1.2-like [Patiria miniata]
MATKSVLILLLVAAATTFAQKQCCYPSQFEASRGSIVAQVQGGQAMTQKTGYQFAYDYTNRRLGAITYKEDLGVMTKFQDIFEYSQGVEYEIQVKPQVSSCLKRTLNATLPHCIPASATYLGSSYLGDHKLNVDYFQYFESKSSTDYANITITVSQGDCVPFSDVYEGMKDGVPTLEVRGYVNYTSGISDPSKYFTVPSFCQSAKHETPKTQKSPFDKILP